MIVLLGMALEQCLDAPRDVVGAVMQRSIQTLNVEMIPTIGGFQRVDFPREGSAGDDQNGCGHRREGQALCASRRSPTMRTAVVAASAASRQ